MITVRQWACLPRIRDAVIECEALADTRGDKGEGDDASIQSVGLPRHVRFGG